MTGFSLDWLSLREPADRAARDADLRRRAATAAGPAPVIVDLACGSGAMMRDLGPALPAGQSWRLVDHDAALLAAAAHAGGAVTTRCMSLLDLEALPLAGATLVTASALTDLVSEAWLAALVARLTALRLPFYATLAYDGACTWQPPHARDDDLVAALNRHQRSDKGFGPALGPAATERLCALLRAAGYRVTKAASPWRLGPDQAALQIATGEGFAQAARELSACPEPIIAEWLEYRRRDAASGQMTIGHWDVLALPSGYLTENSGIP
jgi:hypothetical protein